MSQLIYCDRVDCENRILVNSDQSPASSGWGDLKDGFDNIATPCHLCPDCMKEFDKFLSRRAAD